MSGVEFENCGKYDTDMAALDFRYQNAAVFNIAIKAGSQYVFDYET